MKILNILLLFILCSIFLLGTADSNKLSKKNKNMSENESENEEKSSENKKISIKSYLDNEAEDDEDSDMHFENNEIDDLTELDDESENDYDNDDFMNHYKKYRGVEDHYIKQY